MKPLFNLLPFALFPLTQVSACTGWLEGLTIKIPTNSSSWSSVKSLKLKWSRPVMIPCGRGQDNCQCGPVSNTYFINNTFSTVPTLNFVNFDYAPTSKWDEKKFSYVPDKPRPVVESDLLKWHISTLQVDGRSKNVTAFTIDMLDRGSILPNSFNASQFTCTAAKDATACSWKRNPWSLDDD